MNKLRKYLFIFCIALSAAEMIMLILNLLDYVSCYSMDKINAYTIPTLIIIGTFLMLLEYKHGKEENI